MYRIHFDTQSARWLIQFQQWLWWNTVNDQSFFSLSEAKEYTNVTGISAHYTEKLPFSGSHYMMTGATR